MYDTLHLSYDVTAKRNHKAVYMERFHHFINEIYIIAYNDRNTLGIFVEAGMTT